VSEKVAQFRAMKSPPREVSRCIALATNSFPVPVSPVIRTDTLDAIATWVIRARRRINGSDDPSNESVEDDIALIGTNGAHPRHMASPKRINHESWCVSHVDALAAPSRNWPRKWKLLPQSFRRARSFAAACHLPMCPENVL
jgi:hypothetical protein